MSDEDKKTTEAKLKAWSSYAEISRKWTQIMDAKAGFITALNLGLLSLLWSGVKVQEGCSISKWLGALATMSAIFSICSAILATLPRESLKNIFGRPVAWKGDYLPISFYGAISKAYKPEEFTNFFNLADVQTEEQMAYEALEQHFVISHGAAKKSTCVTHAGWFLFFAVVVTGIAILTKIFL